MNKTLLAACLMLMTFAVSAQTKQTEENKKTESKPMRKIATGSGMEEMQMQIDAAMKEVRIELENLDVRINEEVMRELENLDEVINEEVRQELENLDEEINADLNRDLEELENLDIEINEDIRHDLEHLKDLEIDLDLDLDINIGEIVRHAVNIDVKEITETVNKAVQETIKVTTKKKVQE